MNSKPAHMLTVAQVISILQHHVDQDPRIAQCEIWLQGVGHVAEVSRDLILDEITFHALVCAGDETDGK